MATLGNNHYFLFEKTQVNNVDTLDTVATKSILVCISDSSISSLHISTMVWQSEYRISIIKIGICYSHIINYYYMAKVVL